MKTVQGTNRSYQLVQKTKRKDIDGVIYLVAGEKDIWVKFLKDKSQQKEMEVREQIRNGYGNLFDIPLDVVMDASGFLGYTFKGQEMDIVPVKAENTAVSHKSKTKPRFDSGNIDSKNNGDNDQNNDYQPKRKNNFDNWHNGTITLLGLFLSALLLFSINYFWLNLVIWQQIANYIGYNLAQGGLAISLKGVVPGLVGMAVIITVMKRISIQSIHIINALLIELFAFLIGVLVVDVCIMLLVVIMTVVIGSVQEYMSVIIIAIVIIYIIKNH